MSHHNRVRIARLMRACMVLVACCYACHPEAGRAAEDAPAPSARQAAETELLSLVQKYQAEYREFRAEREKRFGRVPAAKDQAAFVAFGRDRSPRVSLLPRFLDFAERHRGEASGLRALYLPAQETMHDADPVLVDARRRTIGLLRRDYLLDPDLDLCFVFPVVAVAPEYEALLRDARARSPHRTVRAAAAFNLVEFLRAKGSLPSDRLQIVSGRDRGDLSPEAAAEALRQCDRLIAAYPDLDSGKCRQEVLALVAEVERDYADVPCPWSGLDRKDRIVHVTSAKELGELGMTATFGQKARSTRQELEQLAPGSPAPQITGTDADGRKFALSDYRGKVVLLVFSADWCPACVAEYPRLRALQERLKDRPFAILCVSGDAKVDSLRRDTAKGTITWRCWWDGGDSRIALDWNVRFWPTLYLIDAAGKIRDAEPAAHLESASLDLVRQAESGDKASGPSGAPHR